jgi:hypothetical protein
MQVADRIDEVALLRDYGPLATCRTGNPTWRKMQHVHRSAEFADSSLAGSGELAARTQVGRPLLIPFGRPDGACDDAPGECAGLGTARAINLEVA